MLTKNFDAREEFLGFLHCKSGLSGKALSETLLRAVSKLKLDINDCRGQGLMELLLFLGVKKAWQVRKTQKVFTLMASFID